MLDLETEKQKLSNWGYSLFYADGHEIQIHKKGKITSWSVLKDCNNDTELAEYINSFITLYCNYTQLLNRLTLFWAKQMPHLTHGTAKEFALKQIEQMKEEGLL